MQLNLCVGHCRTLLQRLVLLLALMVAIPLAMAKTYYVNTAVTNDAGNGSQASPKKFLTSGLALMSAR